MTIIIYCFIFLAKVVENTLATIRLIVVAKGKKWLGAILHLVASIIWIISTAYVVLNIFEDPFKVVIFSLGTFLGSYFGSLIEEKTTMGSNLLIVGVDASYSKKIRNKFNQYKSFLLKTNHEDIILITIPRKRSRDVINQIIEIDESATIISEAAKLSNIKPN